MSKARDALLGLTLLGLVLSGPAAVAAYLFADDQSPARMTAAASPGDRPSSASTAQISGASPSAGGVLAGMLFTRGRAVVDWNGVVIPVENGSYAYMGGEVVSTDPGSMSLLRLDADNSVYMCPDSRMRLSRGDSGNYQIDISRGGGRFAFGAGTDYRIEVNQGVLSPAAASAEPTVLEVSVFQDHPGGVVCGFSSRVDVAGYPAGGGDGPTALGTAGPGEIIDLARALRAETVGSGTQVVMQPIAMPASTREWLRDNAPYPPGPSPIGYLCRCEELKRYAEAGGIPDAAREPRVTPPESPLLAALALPDEPPLTGFALPSAVLALPQIPDATDPGVLPDAEPEPLTVTAPLVPRPLVPLGGSGGGFESTPS